MSRPRHKWWGYVRRVLCDYPRLRDELDALQAPLQRSGDALISASNSRTVERLATCTLPDRQEQRELEAVEAAIRQTRQRRDGAERLAIVHMVFFRHSHTLRGAADAVHVSYRTARRYQSDMIRQTAYCLGLDDETTAQIGPTEP